MAVAGPAFEPVAGPVLTFEPVGDADVIEFSAPARTKKRPKDEKKLPRKKGAPSANIVEVDANTQKIPVGLTEQVLEAGEPEWPNREEPHQTEHEAEPIPEPKPEPIPIPEPKPEPTIELPKPTPQYLLPSSAADPVLPIERTAEMPAQIAEPELELGIGGPTEIVIEFAPKKPKKEAAKKETKPKKKPVAAVEVH